MFIKAMKRNMTCRDFQYEVGKSYQIEGELKMCENGFHFCDNLDATLSYYNVNSRYFQIAYFGKIIFENDKYASSGIRIIRELEERELIELAGSCWLYNFVKYIDGADKKAIEKRLLKIGNSESLYYFARHIEGADRKAIEKRLLELGESRWLYRFAEYIEGADIEAIEKRLLELEDSEWLYEFAKYVEGANIEAIKKKLIELGDGDLAESLNREKNND